MATAKATAGKNIDTVTAPVLGEDETPKADAQEVFVEHPQYGRVTLDELKELILAEARQDALAGQPEQPAAEDETICGVCFPGGWDAHPTAVASDSVTCEHGEWTKPKKDKA